MGIRHGFLHARGGDAPPVRFTRQEQAVLAALVRRPGQLVSRERLIESLDPNCDGVGERSVDFLVNRLRRKLHDDARRPRFIATRYGQGYVWLAIGRRVDQSFTLLHVDSVYGLTRLSNAEIGTKAVRALATELGRRLQWRCVMATLWSLLIPQQPGTEEPTGQPLHLRAHEAGLLLARSPRYWLEIEPDILKWCQENPWDPRPAILWAANRYVPTASRLR